MIRFADLTTRQQVREMWKTVFCDSDAYIELYFRLKYRDDNCLLYMVKDKVVASLQMIPYQFTFCGAEIPILYLAGVSTLPAYRNRGYVGQLLKESFRVAVRRGFPLMLLVPQEEWLLKFYEKFGFAQTFDAGIEELPSLKQLTGNYPDNLQAAYREFDIHFRKSDMTVQKSFDDFCAIVEEAAQNDFSPVKNLTGMARIIDAERLLSLFAFQYRNKTFSVNVSDELIIENSALFKIADGMVEKKDCNSEQSVGIKNLAKLLLGYHTSKMDPPFNVSFPEKNPQMNFMLE